MSDIFLSYSSSEKERVSPIVQQFEQQGWTVWWDREIPPGKTFDEVIEEALNAAKCVVVVWSAESVKSNWIKTEADEGARRGILIPILIDDVVIPFEFRRIQAARLTDLTKLSSNPELRGLLNSISGLIGKPVSEELKIPERQIEIEERLTQDEERKKEAKRKAAEEEAKRKAADEKRQQQEKITSLYEQAQEQARLHQWQQVQEKMKEIQALDSKFADPKGIFTKAEEELKKTVELLEQDRLKQKAQAKPPKKEVERKRDVLLSLVQAVSQSRNLYFKWVLFTIEGFIGFGIICVIYMVIFLPSKLEFLDVLLFSALFGFTVGIMQLIILKKHLSKAGLWVLVTIIGFVLFNYPAFFRFGYLMSWVLSCFPLGIMQWLILRRHFSKAGWWILVSITSCSFNLLEWSYVRAIFTDNYLSLLGLLVFGGIIHGATSGIALVWVLRHPVAKS